MIFQSFNLITRTTVIKNVLTAFVPDLPWWRATFGIFTKEEKMKALEALDKVGILDKAFVRADQLSGGQQQRVALARTLAQNPQIILADEPVASLDPVTAKQVMDDFQRINRDINITVLINIHHVELALQYATRVVGIRAGEIVYDGPADQVDQAVLDAIYQGKQEESGMSMYDKIFPPKVLTLPNGKQVSKPRSRAPPGGDRSGGHDGQSPWRSPALTWGCW